MLFLCLHITTLITDTVRIDFYLKVLLFFCCTEWCCCKTYAIWHLMSFTASVHPQWVLLSFSPSTATYRLSIFLPMLSLLIINKLSSRFDVYCSVHLTQFWIWKKKCAIRLPYKQTLKWQPDQHLSCAIQFSFSYQLAF